MIQKNCGRCAIRDPKNSVCRLTGWQIDADKDFCSKFVDHLTQCSICGRDQLPSQILITYNSNNQPILICQKCVQSLNTCQMCKNNTNCKFETDPSPLPKVVMKTVRQGNAIMQTQVRNPDRINATCATGCPCYQHDCCLREERWCDKYDENL